MAGFFGLFNYDKEGSGIDKNAPKKKTFVVFFETFFRNVWKFITINFVYCLMCLPIITKGFANAGLTHVARNTARDKHSFGLSDFFETIKKNWKQALAINIINTVVTAINVYALYYYWFAEKSVGQTIGLGVSIFVAFIFSVMKYYMWTMAITFKLTVKQIYSNSFKLAIANLKLNFLCVIVLLLVYALYFVAFWYLGKYSIVIAIEIVLFICTFPGFKYLLVQFCTFPAIKKYMIDPYYAEHPDDDIELRRDLGLEIPQDEEEEETDIE
ncbi:MAG: YesL family protein [Clostridia bacterium]|nr:YesL family protein [Clostridia bacterium]